MATAILRLPVVITRTGLSRSSIYDYAQKGIFPKPIKLGPRAVGWLEPEIEQWIQDQVAANRAGQV